MKKLLLISLSTCCMHAHEYTQHAISALRNKQPQQALQWLHKAQQEQPNDLETLLQLATTHFVLHEYGTAASYYEQALKIQSDTNICYNCATAYSRCGNFSKACALYETVYRTTKSEHAKAHLLKLYLRNMQWQQAAQLQRPQLWWYNDNIYGKTILLDIDKPGNGFGDGIQFIRYAQLLKQAGATVYVKAHTPLIPLLKRCSYINQLFTHDDIIPPCDHTYNICIASLLLCMQDQIMMRSPQRPYLSADPDLINTWKQQINPNTVNIGLCWQSNLIRDHYSGTIMPSPRSISLSELAPLANKKINFYSLQKDVDSSGCPFALTQFEQDFDESHGRFMDTAALIMNMDVIITVDTSIAHLAGALGKPVWLLLSCEPDYRWFTDLDTSPLYPHMKLFRQKEYGNWKPVIASVQHALQEYIKGK